MARIIVVGAGIGGLCAARAAALAGHETTVLERSATLTAEGAGLLLWPNAVRALDALGVGDAVRSISGPSRRVEIRRPQGDVLSTLDLHDLGERLGGPLLAVARPALLTVLADGLEVRCSSRVTAVDGTGAMLGGDERVEADAVVGADGIGSVVRAHVAPRSEPIDTGFTVVRGIAEHPLEEGRGFEQWGRGELTGGISLPHGRSYWFYEGPDARLQALGPHGAIAAERWADPVPALVSATPPEAWLVNRIRRLARVRTWSRGTAVLLGDAVHAMEPNLGQGAAQAIEDAAALMLALRSAGEVTSALERYVELRQRRAWLFQRESSRVARVALSRHSRPRDLLVGMLPEPVRRSQLERLMRRHALDLPR